MRPRPGGLPILTEIAQNHAASAYRTLIFFGTLRAVHRSKSGPLMSLPPMSGVHRLIRVIRCRIFYHRVTVAERSGKTNGRFDAGLCYDSEDDER